MVDVSDYQNKVVQTPQNVKDIIREEYKKCAKDPVYFMRKYCYIQHPMKGKMLFDLYPFQEQCLYDFRDNDRNIILKSRQLGISTLSAGYTLWLMVFHEDKNCLTIATRQEVARNLVTKVRVMYDNLPSWLKQNAQSTEDNKLSLRLSNGSQVKASSTSVSAGRSEAVSLLIIDEAAFIDSNTIEELWGGLQQTMATGGKCIMLSTPNGMGNFFHRMWQRAEEGDNNFHTIKLHWTVHPDRDQTWRDAQSAELGEKLAAQECDCDFTTSGNTVIESTILKWYWEESGLLCDPIERRGFDGNMWVWKYPDVTKSYMVVADVSRGDASDYSSFHIIDIETVEQCATYKGKLDPRDYGNLLVAVATEYNDALLVIENSNIGWAAIQPAIDRGYGNLFYSSADLTVVDIQQQMASGYDLATKSKMTPGFSQTVKNRPLIISKLVEYMRDKAPIIHCKRTINELQNFIWNSSRPEAQYGYNDDLVMSLSIALWVRDTALRLRQQGLDLHRKTVGLIGKSAPVYSRSSHSPQQNPWTMKVGKQDENISWLL
jgi:hypothetical protein